MAKYKVLRRLDVGRVLKDGKTLETTIFLPRGATLDPENAGVPKMVENQHGICPQTVKIDSSGYVNFAKAADTDLLRNGVLGPKTAKERLVVADAERRRKPMIVVPTI